MNPIQESKQELEASIRYAENAIVKANQTIESMATYQEQTGREKALQNQVGELKSECAVLAERIDNMKDSAFADGNTIKHLENVRQELESKVQGQYDDIVQLERDLTVKTSQAEAWKKEARDPKEGAPTMPVIPKDVAIAIFREGMQHGVEAACSEIDNANDIEISETGYTGDFEVSFSKYIDLADHLDTDWMRDKVGDYSEEFVIDALGDLCVDKKFECRIHGVDDQEEKKND